MSKISRPGTWEEPVEKNLVKHNGRKYALYVGNRVSLAHQCQIHGPAKIGDDTFIGIKLTLMLAEIGFFLDTICLMTKITRWGMATKIRFRR